MQKIIRRVSRRVWNLAGEVMHYRKPDLSKAGYVRAFPHQHVVETVRHQLAKSRPLSNTDVSKEDYLSVAESTARFFVEHQRESGEIIDPVDQVEHQYSTACFALLVALLHKQDRASDLVGYAWNALLAASNAICQNRATDNHGDFFLFNIVQAVNILREIYPSDIRIGVIDGRIRKVTGTDAYRSILTPQRRHLNNWNVVASCGEVLREEVGLGNGNFHDRHLEHQLLNFTEDGMYIDPNAPMIYDLFSRFFLEVTLQGQYAGRHRDAINLMLERGELMSLLMQSPAGVLPSGGEAKQHTWGDIQQIPVFEIAARRFESRGDHVYAKAFKRSAHLAFAAAIRWKGPSGELQVVKNHMQPENRHGYEAYSHHSQYSLLSATMLALAADFSDESIDEGPTPCEAGSYTLDIPAFHKVIANHHGTGIVIDTKADTRYDGTGLLRVHQAGGDPILGPNDVPPADDYPMNIGVAWREFPGGDWVHLASHGQHTDIKTKLAASDSTDGTRTITMVYSIPSSGHTITERYELALTGVNVSINVDGAVDALTLTYPCHISDGKLFPQILIEGTVLQTSIDGTMRTFCVTSPGAAPLAIQGEKIAYQNGFVQCVTSTILGRAIQYSLMEGSLSAPAGFGVGRGVDQLLNNI
ncbi:MAG: hypothetical protein RLZ42_129 [Armatimonadota bacterium]